MLKSYIYTIAILLLQTAASCQSAGEFKWPNGAKAALCLTYDDGLPSHIHTVAPVLKKYNFKATFYPTANAASLREEMGKWRALVTEGHELGNHSAYHPCRKSEPGMDWVKDYLDLDKYTSEQILGEIDLANGFLQALDGKKTRTFAYPCGQLQAGGLSFKDSVYRYATAARGSSQEQSELPGPMEIDLFNVPSWGPNNKDGKDLIAYIGKVIDKKTLSTLTFHGVNGEYITVSGEAHEEMLKFLDAHRNEIWVTTFQEATDYLRAKRQKK